MNPPSPLAPHRRGAWWAAATAAVVIVIAVVVTPWAGTRPGFDPYGWLTWGWRTWHGGLNTDAAPSFKPLPYLFTVPYALAGRPAALRLWMDTATAVALAGVAIAGRLAYRLTVLPPGPARAGRWAGWVAAVLAMAAVLGLHDESGDTYLHYVLSAQSDPMVVALALAAIDRALAGRPRAAYACGVLAALGRPEVWPLLAVGAVWLWRIRPGARWLVAGGAAVVLAGWFGIPALSSRSWFVAGDNAYHFAGAPTGDRFTGILHRFALGLPWPLLVAAALCLGAAALRRERTVLLLAGAAVVWIATEIAFTLHGWPGLGRYLFEPAAVAAVLGAAFAGRMLAGGWPRLPVPVWAGAVLAAAVTAAMVSPTIQQARAERRDLIGPGGQHARTAQLEALERTVTRLGGPARVRSCGEAVITGEFQSALAWATGENVSAIGVDEPLALGHRNPLLLFSSHGTGARWSVRALRQTGPGCRSLPGAG